MRQASVRSRRDPVAHLPNVPLLEAGDLPGDDVFWSWHSGRDCEDGFGDDDCYAKLNVACSFDD